MTELSLERLGEEPPQSPDGGSAGEVREQVVEHPLLRNLDVERQHRHQKPLRRWQGKSQRVADQLGRQRRTGAGRRPAPG